MKVLYDISLTASSALLKVFGGFSPKMEKMVVGRKSSFSTLADFVKGNPAKKVWFHVASLGEYEQAKPVIRELKQRYPDKAVVLTFFSPSGYEPATKKPQPHVDFIAYLPFDTPANAEKWVELLQPEMVFFVKYDLWANFIFSINKRKIPLFLFSASLRPDQVYFKSYGGFFRKVLSSFDHIFTQNQQSVELLNTIGYHQATIAGDTRYDNVRAIRQKPKRFPELDAFAQGKRVMVVGSAWEEDMALLIPFINSGADYQFIIAPHDIHPEQIADWQRRIQLPSLKYSELSGKELTQERVLFIDNIGMLSSLYQYARIAYVGGAFGKGLHNILEPLAFGIPVIFGEVKKAGKFPEAAISQSYGCGFAVHSAADFQQLVDQLEDEEKYRQACEAAGKLVADNLGVAQKIIKHIEQVLK
jgi:3-deoxy-D-manno-octulosonic-acid transferase